MKSFLKILFLSLTLHTLNSLYSYSQLVSDFKVNDDTTSKTQYSAKIGVDGLGYFTIVWQDQRTNKPNVYCQRFDSKANFLGTNFRVNTNPDSAGRPSIAVTVSGVIGVSWLEINSSIPNSSKMKCRLFRSDATPITGEILLNDSSGNFDGMPSIGVNGNNEFIIVWEQNGIRFQKIDSIGNKIGVITKVNDYTGFSGTGHPALSIRQDDSFIITWEDTRPPGGPDANDIYFQMFDSTGNKTGVNQKVNDDISTFNLQLSPKVSSDSSGNFVIAWSDDRLDNSHSEIFAQRYSETGVKAGNNFRVTQSTTSYGKGICNVYQKPNGEFLVGWSEFRPFIPKPYFQKYTDSGVPVGNNYLVTNEIPSSEKFYSDFLIFRDKIISLWSDTRNDPFDVYCNIRSFANPDTTVNIKLISHAIPENFILYQNYPNPFNSSTSIRFNVKHYDYYKLEIFNYLGQSVTVLFNQNFNPGTFQITFESFNLSSGLYYYVLSSPNERLVKSLVLLK